MSADTLNITDNRPEYVKRVKAGEFRLMGFGHCVYKNYDTRARIIKRFAVRAIVACV
jgi:citrate synthase